MTGSDAALLEVRGLAKSYGGVRAVVDCSLSVPRQSVVGLIGPNGAGKSTVVEMLSGFVKPDAGTITLDGDKIHGLAAHTVARQGISRTFQTPREWKALTVFENMLVAADHPEFGGVWKALVDRKRLKEVEAEDRSRAVELLDRFGLGTVRDQFAETLSGGQKRLLEFARVAMRRPRVVLLDEPCAGVNPVLRKQIEEAIVGLNADGIAVLLIEHDLQFVERACSRIYVMSLGRTIAEGTLKELRRMPAVVDAYLGEVEASA